jgi:hypothetical protein
MLHDDYMRVSPAMRMKFGEGRSPTVRADGAFGVRELSRTSNWVFQGPVNAPRCPVRNYHRDAAMGTDGNLGATPTYWPNSKGSWMDRNEALIKPPLPIEGDATYWDHRVDDDHYEHQEREPKHRARAGRARRPPTLLRSTRRSPTWSRPRRCFRRPRQDTTIERGREHASHA